MSKIIIDELLDETSFLSDVNDRFKQVEDELNEKVLYRNNPPTEPNGMFNDLDMQENDIINGGSINAKQIVIDGVELDGSVNWGEIGGDIPDQADLEARLQKAENAGLNSITVSKNRLTTLGLEINEQTPGDFEIVYTDRVNESFGGLVRLNNRGQINVDLIPLNLVSNLGFIRGDDLCPKPIDDFNGTPLDCTDPDYRSPTELYNAGLDSNGAAFMINFAAGEVSGSMNLINPNVPLGPPEPILLELGDAIIYLDELKLGDTVLIIAGWHKWEKAVVQNTAEATSFDPINPPTTIIDELSITVNDALRDLDDEAVTAKNHYLIKGSNPHELTPALIGAEPADPSLQGHLVDQNDPHNVTALQVGLDAVDNTSDVDKPVSTAQQAALDLKHDKSVLASDDGLQQGLIKLSYDPLTNTLDIINI